MIHPLKESARMAISTNEVQDFGNSQIVFVQGAAEMVKYFMHNV